MQKQRLRSAAGVTSQLISAFVFAILQDSTILLLPNWKKCQDSSHPLWIVLDMVGNLEDRFSHDAVHLYETHDVKT